MRIQASGATTSTPIDTLTEDELKFLDDVAAADGAPEISGGLMAVATGEDTAHDAQTASSVWRVFADDADASDPADADSAGKDATGELIGFGIRALQGDRHAAEFLIAPDHRDQGLGEQLLRRILDEEPEAWCWSHGDHPAAAHLAQKHGLGRDRVLYQMRTDTGLRLDALPETQSPDGVEIRSFAPGDEDGWLTVNNAAFDWHPEQGGQSRADIDAVVTAADFDPTTFIIAARDGKVIGFHQTKITDTDDEGRLGEVYVVGVDPRIHAKGVGKALTVEGMRRMVTNGAATIELYVESDNAAALGLYERLGFHVAVAHVAYAPASAKVVTGTDSASTASTDEKE
ncbi:Acetyltransferase (GNAT) family protein [Brevibacterium iodinum ATCC 49514]|uniref:Mycothiol synthase n=1 Tax=Brevibacterium iodinum ATCC 49514 TaxID=1255616 RepID=A0A2H1HVY5_9MICO|nr:mycothiol synthase [Brevibacterium iodinum]SMX67105.1 Acetyltransferase (GNAT) family protein [Brevibacterium iodinum ATCC 49514]SUW13674.1 Mycothiol acetyltransferase [Brevibacterium iodinum]